MGKVTEGQIIEVTFYISDRASSKCWTPDSLAYFVAYYTNHYEKV